jgi:hypothetical protein
MFSLCSAKPIILIPSNTINIGDYLFSTCAKQLRF